MALMALWGCHGAGYAVPTEELCMEVLLCPENLRDELIGLLSFALWQYRRDLPFGIDCVSLYPIRSSVERVFDALWKLDWAGIVAFVP